MASFQAIYAACAAICNVLEQSRTPDLYGPDVQNVACRVFTTANFDENVPMNGEVALYLYRVDVNHVQRTLPPRPRYDGVKERHLLPLDLHFLLIPRARTSESQQVILGWMMRVLEDYASLPANILNVERDNTFAVDEHLEITPEALTTDEILRIWDQLPSDFTISVPYCAKVVQIESPLTDLEGAPVLQRDLDFRG